MLRLKSFLFVVLAVISAPVWAEDDYADAGETDASYVASAVTDYEDQREEAMDATQLQPMQASIGGFPSGPLQPGVLPSIMGFAADASESFLGKSDEQAPELQY